MAVLKIPDANVTIYNFKEIQSFLEARGVWHDRWEANEVLAPDATQDEVLDAYRSDLKPFMERGGYKTADVINVHAGTPNVDAIRQKFLAEHTHTEDEIRFFVEGEGIFWFHIGEEVFAVTCRAGDLLSVPANTSHWFDLGPKAHVKAIRVFIDPSGWVANYTGSGIDKRYNPGY
ncbi:MAG: cupin domain-containing protein [Chitinophagaceae bacterium]|nr:cupin domain-containing protein [Oligoflexus sp.]